MYNRIRVRGEDLKSENNKKNDLINGAYPGTC